MALFMLLNEKELEFKKLNITDLTCRSIEGVKVLKINSFFQKGKNPG